MREESEGRLDSDEGWAAEEGFPLGWELLLRAPVLPSVRYWTATGAAASVKLLSQSCQYHTRPE